MTTRAIHIAISLILAGTFLFDGLTPLGYQEFLLYAVPIVLTLWLEQAWSAYLVAGLATLLAYAGWSGWISEMSPVSSGLPSRSGWSIPLHKAQRSPFTTLVLGKMSHQEFPHWVGSEASGKTIYLTGDRRLMFHART